MEELCIEVYHSALDAGEWLDSLPDRFTPAKELFVETAWAVEPIWTLWRKGIPLDSAGSRNMYPVAHRYTDCATYVS
jgi:hypothetical protein